MGQWIGRLAPRACIGAATLLAASAGGAWAEPATEAAGPVTIGEVVVTAQKRTENLQRVPLTIAVVPGSQLQARGIDTLAATATLVPGMVFSRAPDDGLGFTFRGLGTPARTQSFDQSIAVFLDGAFLGKGRLYGANLFDIDQIEFVKSTQSTLLGKNIDVGAISIVTRKPGSVFSGSIGASYEADHGGYILDGAVDLPVSDKLTFRVAGQWTDTNGWVHNSVDDRELPIDKNLGARITAAYTPSDNAKYTLTYQYTDDDRIGNGYQYVDPDHLLPPNLGEGVLDFNKAGYTSAGDGGDDSHRIKAHFLDLDSQWRAGPFRITSVTSAIAYRLRFVDDFDFGPKDDNVWIRNERYWQASEELRVASPLERRFSWVAGVFAFYSDWSSDELQHYDTPVQVGPTSFDTIFLGSFINEIKQRTTNLSAFAQGTWRFTDRLRLEGGLRYTDEIKHGSWTRPALAPFTLWNEVINPPFPKTPLDFSANFPTGNLSLQYDLRPTTMLYAAYGEGEKSGGFADSARVPSGDPAIDARIENERSRSVEAGVKATVFNGAAHLDLAAFYTHIHNFQDLYFTGSEFISQNIPIRSFGGEASFVWQIRSWLKSDNSWTYSDARALLDPSFTPSQSPKWTGYSGLVSQFPVFGDAFLIDTSAYLRYRSSMHNLRSWEFRSAPLTTLDLSLGLRPRGGRWQVGIVATNVTNAVSAEFSFPAPDPTLASSIKIEAPVEGRRILLRFAMDY